MTNARSETIDALKGTAILIVMVGHVLSWNHMEDGYFYDVIKVIQMPLFILISGYLCGKGKKIKNLAGYGAVLRKRVISYLVPFFSWIILLHPSHPFTSIKEVLFCLDKGLWYLMTLFLLNLMTYTAQLVGAKSKDFEKQVFWLVYMGFGGFVVLQTFWGWEFLSPGLTRLYFPFYLIGYLAGEYTEWIKKIPKIIKEIIFGISSVWLLLLVIFCDLLDVGNLLLLGRQLLASILGCYVVIYLVTLYRNGKGKHFLVWLGNYTLEIYVLHFHFATILNQGKSYDLYTWEGVLFVLASFIVMSLITAGIILVTKQIPLLDFILYGKLQTKK